MKNIFRFVILVGFVIMIGAAGSADVARVSFGKILLLEVCGMALVVLGYSALCHYRRYLRKCLRQGNKFKADACVLSRKKELC